ncbi:MAG: secretin N-terminal domain-containing protein [Verrucomicrobiota bacterium]
MKQFAIRILMLSALAIASMQAQNVPSPLPGASTATNRANELQRRFRARTNAVVRTGQITLPSPEEVPGAQRRGNVAVPPQLQNGTNRDLDTNTVALPTAEGTNQTIVNETVVQPPVRTSATNLTVPMPVRGAPERTAVPMPGFPTPGAGASNVAGALPNAVGGTNAPSISNTPLAPGLNPNEIIPAGGISVQAMNLDQFLDIYAMYSGRTVLRPYNLQVQGLTLKAQTDLTRREAVQAMDGVLALNNITMIPIGEKFVKAVPSNLAEKEGAELSHAPADQLPLAEQFITRVVKLKTAKPTSLAPTLQTLAKSPTAVTAIDENQTLILRDYASNIKRMLEIIEKVDVEPESDFSLEVIPIKYGKVADIYASMSALISGSGGSAVGASGAGGRYGGGYGNRMGGGFGNNRFGNTANRFGGGYNNQFGGSYGGNYGGGYTPYSMDKDNNAVTPQQVAPGASAGGGQSSFQRRLNDIVNRAANPEQVKILENANIVPDERSNKLLIYASKKDMAMITNIVSKVDVMLSQVLIEAIILEVNLGDNLKVGVSAVQNPKKFGEDFTGAGAVNNGQSLFNNLTNFPAGAPSGFSYFGKIGNDFDVAINAIASDSKINIVSKPRIQTSHAIPGFFFVGQTFPYVTGTYDYGLVGGVSSRSQITQQQIGLTLDVTPYITPEGMVVMEINQDFGQRDRDVIIDGNPIPVVNQRSASATLTVRNGDIIMLGGFISDSHSTGKSGVPFLKDIPGLGVLFRTKNDDNSRTELVILLKATVLETPEAAAFMADSIRRDLPGVRQAEREFSESDRKRMKKVEKKEKK